MRASRRLVRVTLAVQALLFFWFLVCGYGVQLNGYLGK